MKIGYHHGTTVCEWTIRDDNLIKFKFNYSTAVVTRRKKKTKKRKEKKRKPWHFEHSKHLLHYYYYFDCCKLNNGKMKRRVFCCIILSRVYHLPPPLPPPPAYLLHTSRLRVSALWRICSSYKHTHKKRRLNNCLSDLIRARASDGNIAISKTKKRGTDKTDARRKK